MDADFKDSLFDGSRSTYLYSCAMGVGGIAEKEIFGKYFLEKVLEERGHELWFEGARRTDLIRYGKYIEYAKKYRGSVTAKDYMNVMPLPQSVINEGKGIVLQNPEY